MIHPKYLTTMKHELFLISFNRKKDLINQYNQSFKFGSKEFKYAYLRI